MTWATPAYLWLLLLAVPVAALAIREVRRRRQEFTRLAGPGFSAPARGTLARTMLLAGGSLLLMVSLCGPQFGLLAEEHEAKGVDILVALDTSRSMLADDLRPTRLAAAKSAIAALSAGLHGDRIGLIAFAGSAFLVCPLTSDYGVFAGALSETGVDSISLGGTSLAAALREARRAFAGSRGSRVLILVSDGEDQGADGGAECAAAARALREDGVALYAVAAGSPQGALIPLAGEGFLKDRAGAVVKSRLQTAPLRDVAGGAGGHLLELGAGPAALADLYRDDLAQLERTSHRSVQTRLAERFQIPLALALALLALEPLLGSRGRR
jgi:Ca-activated chloride channel homolog